MLLDNNVIKFYEFNQENTNNKSISLNFKRETLIY